MAPGDAAKTITANLIGGSAADVHHFKWWADNYDILDLNYTGGSAVIRPLTTGKTTLHISHPKAAYNKDIIVYISEYSEFAFEKLSLNTKAGSREFVKLQIPVQNVSTRIAYTVEKENGAPGTDILQASGTASVCILEARSPGTVIVTARLNAVSSGLGLAQSRLLVHVEKGDGKFPYINFPGSSMFTLERGASKTLRAGVAGGANLDSRHLRWKANSPHIIELSPSSASSWTAGEEVRVKAKAAGECTLTLQYGDGDTGVNMGIQPLSVLIIVPGSADASVSLDASALTLYTGEKPGRLSASIKNAGKSDWEELEWNVEQDEARPAVTLSGKGAKISILPENAGAALVTASLPSTGASASCRVTVEQSPYLIIRGASAAYPRKVFSLDYEVSPASYTDKVEWKINNDSYGRLSDGKNGKLFVTMGEKEGTAVITGRIRATGAEAKHSVSNYWGNTFHLGKQRLFSVPEDRGEGEFETDYSVQPSCAELYLSFEGKGTEPEVFLSDGTKAVKKAGSGDYVIGRSNHSGEEREALGRLRFAPRGEFDGKAVITAVNPIATLLQDGSFRPEEIASRELRVSLLYPSLNYTARVKNTNGKWSEYREGTRMLVLGDGETVELEFNLAEEAALGNNRGKALKAVSLEITDESLRREKSVSIKGSADLARGLVIIAHRDDLRSPLGPGVIDDLYASSTAVARFIQAGFLHLSYCNLSCTNESQHRTFSFPLYVAVRYCDKNYKP
jgi:hypothetical protein